MATPKIKNKELKGITWEEVQKLESWAFAQRAEATHFLVRGKKQFTVKIPA